MKQQNKYIETFKIGIQSSMAYRMNFFLSLLSTIFPIFIQFFLWTAVFNHATSETVYGYTFAQMLTYTVLSAITTKLVSTGFEYEIVGDIKNGGLNKFIVRPVGYFPYRVSCFLGEKSMQLIIMLGVTIGALIGIHYIWGLVIVPIRVVLFIVVVLLAVYMNFLIFYAISAIGFWLTEVAALFECVRILAIIVSGGIFPTDIFGEKICKILSFLPFKYTTQYPVDLLNNRLSYSEIGKGMLVQLIWIILLMFIAKSIWRIGMKKYVAVGG